MNEQKLSTTIITGLLSILLVLALAAICIMPTEPDFFVAWLATAFMAATPTQVIIGLLWENNKPDVIARLPQPYKGIAFTALTVVIGAIVLTLVLSLVGGGHGPTPMLIQYTIMTVVSILWLVAIWHCWPLSKLSDNPVIVGTLTLLTAYILAYLLWTVFFDYSFLGEINHPQYYADIDPGGLFPLWSAMTFFVTSAGLIIMHALLDFWPLDKLCREAPQPLRGIISTVYILILSWILRAIFVDVIGMEQVDYMVRVPVSLIFGAFLVSNMMQFSLFPTLQQPVKGIALSACAIIIALVMHELYAFASSWHATQDLATGPENGFARELWIASAMLGVTFPIIFVVSGFLNFWPLKR